MTPTPVKLPPETRNIRVGQRVWDELGKLAIDLPACSIAKPLSQELFDGLLHGNRIGVTLDAMLPPDAVVPCDERWVPIPIPVTPTPGEVW